MHTRADIDRAAARVHALLARVGVALIAVTQHIAGGEGGDSMARRGDGIYQRGKARR